MILAKKVRLYPTEIQEQKLWQSVGTARFIYNWTIADKKRIIRMVVSLFQMMTLEKK